jgi:hypothetical protein
MNAPDLLRIWLTWLVFIALAACDALRAILPPTAPARVELLAGDYLGYGLMMWLLKSNKH